MSVGVSSRSPPPGWVSNSSPSISQLGQTIVNRYGRPLAPISLKGISREVIPYVVEGIHDEAPDTAPGVINEYAEGARIFLDLERLTEVERDRLHAVLTEAVEVLKRRQPLPS